jgi:hypothetical protein
VACDQARIRAVWHELQTLDVGRFPNAISALLRILVELSTESLLRNTQQELGQGLSANFRRAMTYLRDHAVIDEDYFIELDRMRQHTELISIQSMQRYVHSPNFAPLPDEIAAHWMRLRMYVVACSRTSLSVVQIESGAHVVHDQEPVGSEIDKIVK